MFDLQGKKVLVMGLGLLGGGVSVTKYLANKGADVKITDLKSKEELSKSISKLASYPDIINNATFGKHIFSDFEHVDIVVPNPGVLLSSKKYISYARKHNALILNEAALFFLFCKRPIIAVTGTRGKSTTATLIRDMLINKYPKTLLAGNIKDVAMFDIVDKVRDESEEPVVLELSSWHAEGLSEIKERPYISVITNLYQDHMNAYKKLDDYYDSKFILCSEGTNIKYSILNFDSKEIKKRSKNCAGKIIWVSSKGDESLQKGFYIRDDFVYGKGIDIKAIKLPDLFLKKHLKENALNAIAVSRIMNVSESDIKKALKEFKPLSGRQEVLGVNKSITYINDTNATSPEATEALINSVDSSKLILILGGASKNLSYKSFMQRFIKNIKGVVFLPGQATKDMKENMKGIDIKYMDANTLSNALENARSMSVAGDVIALSPAASSFNLFKNEFDRGEQFKKLVSKFL